jgi:hypothetical protein
MPYTVADLESAKAALLALAQGARVASVGAADRSVQYQQADMDKLRALIADMEASIQSSEGRRRFVLTTTGKGL